MVFVMQALAKRGTTEMPRPLRVLSTLCPKRLYPSDLTDLSGVAHPKVKLPCGKTLLYYHGYQLKFVPFPPGTRGFLYYHSPPKAPPFIGEVRFRLASDLDSFHNGVDLLSADKPFPWSISALALANQSTYANLRKQLLTDGVVSEAALDKWAEDKLPHEPGRVMGHDVLYYLRQPFFLRFETYRTMFYTATREQIGLCVVLSPLADQRGKNKFVVPYSGELPSRLGL